MSATRALLLLALLASAGACSRAPTPAPAPSPSPPAPVPTPIAAATDEADPIVADVDLGVVRASDVRARLPASAGPRPDPEAVLAAIGAAVLDTLALRELAVLDLRPAPGEPRAAAVDRLLQGAFSGVDCARVTDETIRIRYLSDVRRWRHPRSLTVWEAGVVCCEDPADCDMPTRTSCLSGAMPALQTLRKRLAETLPALEPPRPVTPGTDVALADSPCQQARIPAFEAAVAAAGPPIRLRRYTFFPRADRRFPAAAFRRADPLLEPAVEALAAIGALTPVVETSDGAAFAMAVAHEPASFLEREDTRVVQTLRREACADLARAERDAFLERLGRAADVRWRTDAMRAAFGVEVAGRLQPWRLRETPHVPDMLR
ncbi:MAG: hypothetical protein RIT45_64 [Pseudomonadota bacterium]